MVVTSSSSSSSSSSVINVCRDGGGVNAKDAKDTDASLVAPKARRVVVAQKPPCQLRDVREHDDNCNQRARDVQRRAFLTLGGRRRRRLQRRHDSGPASSPLLLWHPPRTFARHPPPSMASVTVCVLVVLCAVRQTNQMGTMRDAPRVKSRALLVLSYIFVSLARTKNIKKM